MKSSMTSLLLIGECERDREGGLFVASNVGKIIVHQVVDVIVFLCEAFQLPLVKARGLNGSRWLL